ncbi:MAG: 50S ribosomal protein L3 [Clostridia bacterium]
MNKAILGKKLGMSQIFTADGHMISVTVVEAGPCTVIQKKTVAKEGYDSVQISFGDIKIKNVTKPIASHYKKADAVPQRFLREFRFDDCSKFELGSKITVKDFAVGDMVVVAGKTRGRGFTGAIYRWNQHIGPKAHGSGYHRGVGSMGSSSDPSRVFKNKHMSGHYGNERVTVKNLEVVRVDEARNLLLIKGGIPGPKGCLVEVKA